MYRIIVPFLLPISGWIHCHVKRIFKRPIIKRPHSFPGRFSSEKNELRKKHISIYLFFCRIRGYKLVQLEQFHHFLRIVIMCSESTVYSVVLFCIQYYFLKWIPQEGSYYYVKKKWLHSSLLILLNTLTLL